jgi:hypothetical protein
MSSLEEDGPMTSTQRRTGRSPARTPLLSKQALMQLRWWSSSQWLVAGVVFVLAFVVIGQVGQTLPPTNAGRTYPVEWWNWVTLPLSAALLGLIAGTFVRPGGRRVLAGAGSGSAGTVAAVVMACPVCSPLAIPLLGTSGALAFLVPDRGLIALASLLLLVITLLLRLRAASSCAVSLAPLAPAA